MPIFWSLALIANVDMCWIQMGVFSEALPREKHWSLKASLLFDRTWTVLYISKGDLVEITFDPCNYILGWWGQGPDSRRSPNQRRARSPPPPRRPPPRSPQAPTPPPPRRSRRTRSCRWSLEPPWGRLGVKSNFAKSPQAFVQTPRTWCVLCTCLVSIMSSFVHEALFRKCLVMVFCETSGNLKVLPLPYPAWSQKLLSTFTQKRKWE